MLLGHKDPRMKQALGEWARIAPDIGFDPADFRAQLIWQKNEPTRSHVVLRLRGPKVLVLKRTFLCPSVSDLSQIVAAQNDAYSRLRPYPKAHAPEILHSSDGGDLIIMQEALGKTLDDHLELARAPAPLLKRSGAWLTAFHESSDTEKRTYQPHFMVTHCERMADEVEAGKTSVADPRHFMACCRMVRGKAKTAKNQETTSATKHGDFNLRNIMLGSDGETGLDFKPLSTAPVGFDIARILMDYAELFQSNDDLAPGQLLTDATITALFGGYDLVTKNDPGVAFLPFTQLLNDWRIIPSDPNRRSWRQNARYHGIVALVSSGFGIG